MRASPMQAQDPYNPDGLLPGTKVADVLFNTGDIQAAATIYGRLLKQDPENSQLWLRYAAALYSLGAYSDALAAYENRVFLSENACDGLVGAGRSRLQLAKPALAGTYFKRCLQQQETNEDALIGQAISHDMADQWTLSHSFYRKAIAANPKNVNVRNNFAMSLMLAGNISGAIAELTSVAFGARSTVQIRQNLALAYGLQGDRQAAAQIAALDLPSNAVEANLKYYELIRHMAGNGALKAALFAEKGRQ